MPYRHRDSSFDAFVVDSGNFCVLMIYSERDILFTFIPFLQIVKRISDSHFGH